VWKSCDTLSLAKADGVLANQSRSGETVMSVKYFVSLFAVLLCAFTVSPSHGAELVSCNGFESCPTDDGDAIVALEARIAALEALLPEVPSSGIILWDSTSSCPTGYTAVTTAYVGGASLDDSYLRATSGSGAGTVSGSSSVSPAISATSTGTVGSTNLAHTHSVSGLSTYVQDILAAYREGTGAYNITGDHNHAFNVTSGAPSPSMNHAHSVSISTTGSVTVGLAPLGYGVLLCRKD
jgi:hypothetical protein